MTVESYYVTTIAMLSDWLKRLAPVFQFLWSITLFAPIVIGRSNPFGFGFFDSHLKTTLFASPISHF